MMCSIEEINKSINIFNNLPNIGVMVTDINGIIQYVNPIWLKQTGYSEEEIIGQKPSIFKSNFHSNDFYKELWETILSGSIYINDVCNKKKDGTHFWERLTILPFSKVGQTKIENFIAFLVDITEQRANELKLQAILESSPDIIVIYDLDTLVCLDIYSDFAFEIFPNLRNYKGKTAYELFSHQKDFEKIIFAFEKIKMEPEKIFISEHSIIVRMVDEDGEEKMVERVMEAFYKKFNHNKCLVTVRDVTQRKEIQLYKKLKQDFIDIQKNIQKINRFNDASNK